MKLGGKILGLVAIFGCAIAACALVNDGGNPFHPIVVRNVFGLHDPPVVTNTEPVIPSVKITLTGITTFLGQKNALLEWPDEPQAARPGQLAQPAGKHYAMLTEGRRDGIVEVVSIDDKSGIVKVKNNNQIETLSFEKNGAKLPPGSPLPAALGGLPPPPGYSSIPAAPAGGGYGTPGASTVTAIGGGTAGAKGIPSRQMRLPTPAQPAAATTTTTTAAQPVKSIEEQAIMFAIEDKLNEGNPKHPPSPPTPINPEGGKVPPPPPPPGPK